VGRNEVKSGKTLHALSSASTHLLKGTRKHEVRHSTSLEWLQPRHRISSNTHGAYEAPAQTHTHTHVHGRCTRCRSVIGISSFFSFFQNVEKPLGEKRGETTEAKIRSMHLCSVEEKEEGDQHVFRWLVGTLRRAAAEDTNEKKKEAVLARCLSNSVDNLNNTINAIAVADTCLTIFAAIIVVFLRHLRLLTELVVREGRLHR
jgi:hypothetical protein